MSLMQKEHPIFLCIILSFCKRAGFVVFVNALQKVLMSLFFVLSLFFVFPSYGAYRGEQHPFKQRGVPSERESQKAEQAESEIKDMQNQSYKDMILLLSSLADESTSEDHKIEILKEIRGEMAFFHKEIMDALKQVVLQDTECNGEDCVIVNMAGLKAQAELIRRSAVMERARQAWAQRSEKERDNFYVNLNLDMALATVGAILLWVPGGQPISIPLLAGRSLTLTGTQALGSIAIMIEVPRIFADIWNFLSPEERETFAIFPELVLREPLMLAMFSKLVQVQEELKDKELIERLLSSESEEDIVDMLAGLIRSENEGSENVRVSAIQALGIFEEEIRLRKTEVINLLMELIEEQDQKPEVREAAVRVLRKVALGNERVAEYLEEKAKDEEKKESLEFRFLVVVDLGRDELSFPASVILLKNWLHENNNSVPIAGKIPDYFITSLLSSKPEESSKPAYIAVLRKFIEIGGFDQSLKLKASAVLIDWNPEDLETKTIITGIYFDKSFLTEFSSYRKELLKEYADASEIFNNISSLIDTLREANTSPETILLKLKVYMQGLVERNPSPALEKALEFIIFYEKVKNFIRNKTE